MKTGVGLAVEKYTIYVFKPTLKTSLTLAPKMVTKPCRFFNLLRDVLKSESPA